MYGLHACTVLCCSIAKTTMIVLAVGLCPCPSGSQPGFWDMCACGLCAVLCCAVCGDGSGSRLGYMPTILVVHVGCICNVLGVVFVVHELFTNKLLDPCGAAGGLTN